MKEFLCYTPTWYKVCLALTYPAAWAIELGMRIVFEGESGAFLFSTAVMVVLLMITDGIEFQGTTSSKLAHEADFLKGSTRGIKLVTRCHMTDYVIKGVLLLAFFIPALITEYTEAARFLDEAGAALILFFEMMAVLVGSTIINRLITEKMLVLLAIYGEIIILVVLEILTVFLTDGKAGGLLSLPFAAAAIALALVEKSHIIRCRRSSYYDKDTEA